jgi:iron-sulfur cluster assembly protein
MIAEARALLLCPTDEPVVQFEPMNIQITPAARRRMQTFLADQPDAVGVRFGVRKTGCSGYAYMVEIAEQLADGDRVIEQDGIKLIVDTKSLPLVDGTEIDFARQGLNSTFVFRNPNVTGECGCGESFTVEERGLRAEG